MRQRSTWSKQAVEAPRTAATSRRADIYTMNQEHPQPSPVDYETGSPDAWAETPVPGDKMSVNAEYEGDHVKRNEVGFGEYRDDTWKHKDSDQWNGKGKYDNAKVAAERKAQAAERLARAVLRTSNDKLVEDAALDFMAMPSKVLAATLKRMDAVSPDALPKEAKYRRALACCKLAARTLGASANESQVEHLGSVYMSLDDPTLKDILKSVASVRMAEQQEQEESDAHTSQTEKTGQQGLISQQEQQVSQQEQPLVSQQDQGMSEQDLACLDEMLHEETGAPPAPAVDDLQALFAPAAPAAPMAPVAPAVPMMASESGDISFDDDDGEEAPPAVVASEGNLDDLFNDHPEVVAQREIHAAELEQRAREGGFAPVSGRTASTKGVKKLGAVKSSKTSNVDDALGSLWERPGA